MHETDTDVVTTADRHLVAEVTDLMDRMVAVTGLPGLSEDRRRALERAATASDRRLVAVRMRNRSDGRLVGYAQLDQADPLDQPDQPDPADERSSYSVEVVALPTSDNDAVKVADQRSAALLALAMDAFGTSGGGRLRLWIPAPTEADERRVGALGFSVERELMQLRCRLPLPPSGTTDIDVLPIRAFQVGSDEEQWLIANNRAFATHPEQGRWDLTAIEERESEPWFDPDGFLVLEAEGRMAGFCWTKVHSETLPPMGEIYVIGVDPDFHGRGWGRALTRAGFDWMAEAGLTVGMLYVDSANTAAVALYRSMGMETHHRNRAYIATVPASPAP